MKTEELMAAFESLLPEHRLLTDIQNTLSTTRRGDVYVIDEETLHVPCDVSLSLIRKTMRFEFNDGAPYVSPFA